MADIGFCTSIELVSFQVKDPPFTVTQKFVTWSPTGNPPRSHTVFKVTTKTGNTYALDLAGSQYGWFDPVCDWSTFLDKRCRSGTVQPTTVSEFKSFGLWTTPLEPPTYHPKDSDFRATVAKSFYERMATFMQTANPLAILSVSESSVRSFEVALVSQIQRHAALAASYADCSWIDIVPRGTDASIELQNKRQARETNGLPAEEEPALFLKPRVESVVLK